MKTAMIALAAAVSVGGFALPAAAQHYGRPAYDRAYDRPSYDRPYDRTSYDRVDSHPSVDLRQARIARQIERATRRGALAPWELDRVNTEYRQIARLEWRYVRNGLSAWERNDLSRRLGHLEVVLHQERTDRDYAYGDRYGRR